MLSRASAITLGSTSLISRFKSILTASLLFFFLVIIFLYKNIF
nr:MAG TPA: hypothetical protein [Caudoviricetes sp.]